MTETAFWNQTTATLIQQLAASENGLTSQEAARRLLQCGSNTATAPRQAPPWLRFIRLFANPLVIILLVASALSAVTGDVVSFVIIAAIVLLSVLLDFVQPSRAQSAVDALREQGALRADVRRDGAETSLPVAQLVPGDIVRLAAGDLVPADGVLLAPARGLFSIFADRGRGLPCRNRTREALVLRACGTYTRRPRTGHRRDYTILSRL